jgi:CheY-like chemotaxis protein
MDLPILVVEDDPDGREVVSRMLRYHRIGVEMVNDAEEALEKLASSDYSAVIIDLNHPWMGGRCSKPSSNPRTSSCVVSPSLSLIKTAVKAIETGLRLFSQAAQTASFVRNWGASWLICLSAPLRITGAERFLCCGEPIRSVGAPAWMRPLV